MQRVTITQANTASPEGRIPLSYTFARIQQPPLTWQSPLPQSRNSNERAPYRVLIIDDDINLTRLLRTILRTAGFEVLTADSAANALSITETDSVDVIVLDLRMPVVDGRTLFRQLRARGVQSPVLIASAYGARAAQMELGAEGAIEKPFDPDRLIAAVTELMPSSDQEAPRARHP
jgi:DNA-binding response OmpR family regulator